MRSVNGNLNKWRIAFLLGRNPPIVRSLGQADIELGKTKVVECCMPCFFHHQAFSTGFASVHGERPSAEYARLRKESLENEFGHALGTYSSSSFSSYFRFGPFLALYRATIISFQVAKLTLWHFFLQDIRQRAIKFRETLIRLGPFYVKLGQVLSTRPDILPKVYCQELAKLQDQIPPFPNRTAIKSIESQLGAPISQIFADISPEPIAAASLGQVYKARLHSGELVAVKVQRPGMSLRLTLDALLFHMIGGQLKRFAKARKDLLVAVNEMVRHMFEEIDYVLEGQNAERFDSLYGRLTECGHGQEKETTESVARKKNANYVKVPKIYWNLTRKAVLTMEWIDGIKLTDADRLKKACLNRVELIDQGLYCSLRQLLEVGFFHADPHPGNLVATEDGFLAYFDFGMMGDIPRHYRVGLIQVLVHFVNRDSWALANDFLSLGFIPDGVDLPSVSDALQASFGSGNRHSQDFQSIMNQLYDVMYEFNFSLPPDYALVVRALGSLEGTAKALDPDFKVVESAYPFVIGRLLADPSADMRKILRQLLIHNNGSIRWNRLERLVAAISEEVSESTEEPVSNYEANRSSLGSKSFDMDSVVAATEDLLHFILSEKGWRVRVFLVQDIVKASDLVLQEEIFEGIVNEKEEVEGKAQVEVKWIPENGYKNLKITVEIDNEIDAQTACEAEIKRRYKSLGSLRIVADRGLQVGDVTILNISTDKSTSGNEEIPSTESKGFQLDTEEADHLPPGFLEAIVGIQPSETRSFPIVFPESWEQENLRGVQAQYTVECKELFYRVLPELDDAVADRLIPDCSTLNEVRESILQRCKELEQTAKDQATDNAILDQLRKMVEIDIPQSIFEDQGRQLYGATLLEIQAKQKLSEEQLASLSSPKAVNEFLENQRESITDVIKQNLAVADIFKRENLQLPTDEILREVENSIAEFKRNKQEYDEERIKDQVQEILEGAKVLEWLREHAHIKYVTR